MKKAVSRFLFRIIRGTIKLVYPKTHARGLENLPDEPAIYVGNHTQMNGPIVGEIYFPVDALTWCTHEMMVLKEVPAYAFQDFWSQKPRWTHPFFRLLSYVIAPIAVIIFNNAKTLPVYRDMRVMETYRKSVETLCAGKSLFIFPEYDQKYNHILYEFQDRFIDTARYYYRKSGKAPLFVPVYLAPKLKTFYFGRPVRFDPSAPIKEERERIKAYLKEEITRMAESLPRHRVIPYRNIPKRDYPYNIPEATRHDQANL